MILMAIYSTLALRPTITLAMAVLLFRPEQPLQRKLFLHNQGSVIVTMISIRVMQMLRDQIISVIAMRNGNVATARAMRVIGSVFVGPVAGRALVGVSCAHR
jgi:hypothetical protein